MSSFVRDAPGPEGHPVFGNLYDIQGNTHTFYANARNLYGDVVRFRGIGTISWYLISHPKDIDYVLRINAKNYLKESSRNKRFEELLGSGLLSSEGETWRKQRRIVQPVFHRSRLTKFSSVIEQLAQELTNRWEDSAMHKEPLNILEEMKWVTLRIIMQILLSDTTDVNIAAMEQALRLAFMYQEEQIQTPFAPTSFADFSQARAVFNEVIHRILRRRHASVSDSGDLLSMILTSYGDHSDLGMNEKELLDEVVSIIIASHESADVLLSWSLYLLTKHPHIEQRLLEEVNDICGNSNTIAEYVPHLKYTKMVIEESMRLYPPAWRLVRQAQEEDVIGTYRIPAQSIIHICPYVTHRHPALWEQPEVFDPERFSLEQAASRPRFAYFPFGGGQHQCVGSDLALLEMQILLATIVRRYHLTRLDGHEIQPIPLVSLRPEQNIFMIPYRRP